MSKENKAQQLEESFIGIRDEWRLHKNTANRIGTALLELLHFSNTGEFDDMSQNAASQMSVAEYVEEKIAEALS